MTLSKPAVVRSAPYDWHLFRDMCLQNPGEWICEDDPDRPTTTPYQIRRGQPVAFDPPGAFDAMYRKNEGTFVRYVGVPVEPWAYYEGAKFDDLERTFDPDRFPESTPADFVALATVHTPAKFIKRDRKSASERQAGMLLAKDDDAE